MDNLIPIINKLQDVFTAVGVAPLSLPQLVVVGSQSAGKSSVLETIVGRDFLPRGSNIVTRRPLVLQLIHTPAQVQSNILQEEQDAAVQQRTHTLQHANDTSNANGSASRFANVAIKNNRIIPTPKPEEWGEFLHHPGVKYTDFIKIREEINADTDRIAGSNKGVSHKPINLKIFSPKVLNLTLVDLPGITKVPVGDQPQDIESQIRELVLSFITPTNSIIVAVTPANNDIANSDALKLAREVDPQGSRTIGVVTKLDLMDRGTDAMDVLLGKVVHLQHGFVGVVNRGQHDINTNKSVSAALIQERQFFATHNVYRSIASRLGTPYLAKKLSSILMSHIQKTLPELRQRVQLTISETRDELDSYGYPLDDMNMGSVLLPMIGKFCTNFQDALDGKLNELANNQLYGGARLSWLFHDVLGAQMDKMSPWDTLSDRDIRTAIKNASGSRPALFIPEISFELLVKKLIERLQPPCIECVDLVYSELQRLGQHCQVMSPGMSRFPAVKDGVMHCVGDLLASRVEPTKLMIQNIVQCQLAYINTNHPDFIGGSKAVSMLVEKFSKDNEQRQALALQARPKTSPAAPNAATSFSSHSSSETSPNLPPVYPPPSPAPNTASQPAPSLFGLLFRSNTQAVNSTLYDASSASTSNSSVSTTTNNSNSGTNADSMDSRHKAIIRRRSKTLGFSEHDANKSELNGHTSMHHSSRTAGDYATHFNATYNMVDGIPPTERELIETEVIKLLLSSYFDIVRKSILDIVPKTIMCFLVNYTKSNLQAELVKHLYNPNQLDQLLAEPDEITEKRAACEDLLQILYRANDILQEASEYALHYQS